MEVPAKHLRFPLFDSLRGIAALSILVFHVALFTVFFAGPVYSVPGELLAHLNIGVPFFFLLSAFLLYRPFVATRVAGGNRPSFSGYAKRRFLRVVPAYWAALTITAVVPGMAGAFSNNWWAYYGLMQNFPIFTPEGACAADSYRCAIPPAWSLGVEVLFYALLPLIVIALAWLGRERRTRSWLIPELGAISMLALVSLPLSTIAPTGGIALALNFSPFGAGLWFALGLGLASLSVWVEHRAQKPRWVSIVKTRPWVPLTIGTGMYAAVSVFVLVPYPLATYPLRDVSIYPIEFVSFGVIALLFMLPATFGVENGGAYRRLLNHRITTWLGLISYGVFLWHFPALVIMYDLGATGWWPSMSFVVLLSTTLGITIACAAISYYTLERPLMQLGQRRQARCRIEAEPLGPPMESILVARPASPAIERDHGDHN